MAYGEIGSSLYYALGITAVYALSLTPVVFLAAGFLFALAAAAYAEGGATIPEPGGAAAFARRAFNDLVGFIAGLGDGARLRDRDLAGGPVPAALHRRARSGTAGAVVATRRAAVAVVLLIVVTAIAHRSAAPTCTGLAWCWRRSTWWCRSSLAAARPGPAVRLRPR